MQWQDLTPSHYEGQWELGGGHGGGERERAGDQDKLPFVYTQGGKRRTVCGGWGGSLEWLHGSCRLARRVSFG